MRVDMYTEGSAHIALPMDIILQIDIKYVSKYMSCVATFSAN